ncbi:MAG: S8 family peptidase [Saprospiraceae bacterium]|nr:S8 family peptidase [Saprospiraceae bacterium]
MKLVVRVLVFFLFVGNAFSQDDLKDWYHKDPSEGYMGVSIDKAYAELLKGKQSQPVIVAIIDSGVDIYHEDLADNIWTNPGEIPDNNIDDDGNGYIDDVNGWNFIGGPDGKNVGPDSYEVTRLYGKYKYKYENANPILLNDEDKKEYLQFQVYKKEVDKNRSKAQKAIDEVEGIRATVMASLDALKTKLDLDSLEYTYDNLSKIETADQFVIIGGRIIQDFAKPGEKFDITEIKEFIEADINKDINKQREKLDFAYNPDYDPRSTIVMDDYSNSKETNYGNNDVKGPDSFHGTHVAGIVGAVQNNDIGMNGVASNVRIMSVRTVPDGDERDKDVANAIRYAVDNGASIINMSFGKGYAWDKDIVDDAVKYATKKDVLLVHAAGNSAQDNDETGNFPNDKYNKASGFLFWKKKKSKNWIEVGALSPEPGENSVASFSNYGQTNVDIFAPGVQIYATLPENKYSFLQGTSMASPVVAGVAAVLRSYFPTLRADQIKEIIMESATPLDLMVKKPGDKSGELVEFKTLSVQGGTVNLYNAVKLAQNTKGKKKLKKQKKGNA